MSKETSLCLAMVECQKSFVNLGVNKKGFNYEYLTLDKLIEETRPTLAANGLFIVQTMRVTEGGHNILQTKLMHVEGASFESEYVLEPVNVGKSNAAQMMGASITYARRYCLAAMLNIAQSDSDGVNPLAPPKPDPLAAHREALENTKDLAELQAVFTALPAKYKAELAALKDARKIALAVIETN